MQDLVSQSSQRTFSTAASGEDPNAINGLYQCRGDLSTSQCYSCVSKIPKISDKVCGKAVAARVPETEFLYKVCGSSSSGRTEFEKRRETAFNMAEE
ncbi:hypothetical protein Goarm_018809, partial [Gossypium armourianum]|nr:hypothetical protein [Gossypium armourianum]